MAEEHKGGVRLPDYLREMALGRVESLMIEGFAPNMIAAKVIDEGLTDSPQTVKGWRLAVQKRWAAEDAELRPARKDLWRRRIEARYQELLVMARTMKSEFARVSAHEALIKLSKLGILLDGAHLPVVLEADGRLDPAAMAPAEREREIEALLAKRQAAREAVTGKGTN